MKRLFLFFSFFLLFKSFLFGAIKYDKEVNRSSFVLVFRISDSIAGLINHESRIDPNWIEKCEVIDSIKREEKETKIYSWGHYVFAEINERELSLTYKQFCPYFLFDNSKSSKAILKIIDNSGQEVNSGILFFENKERIYNKKYNGFTLPNLAENHVYLMSFKKDSITYFWKFSVVFENNYPITYKMYNYNTQTSKNWRKYSNGYVVFNKPKYLPGDTVKFKAHFPGHTKSKLKIKYSSSGDSKEFIIHQGLSPTKWGSYIYEFILGDSFLVDKNYSLVFYKRNKYVFSGSFTTEDYHLDETKYNFSLNKLDYIKDDTVWLNLSSKNQFGEFSSDAKATVLFLFNSEVDVSFKDTMFIPDTLLKREVILNPYGETKVPIPLNNWACFKGYVNVKALFINDRNEIKDLNSGFSFNCMDKSFSLIKKEKSFEIEAPGYNKSDSFLVSIYALDGRLLKNHVVTIPYRDTILNYFSTISCVNLNTSFSAFLDLNSARYYNYNIVEAPVYITKDSLFYLYYNLKDSDEFSYVIKLKNDTLKAGKTVFLSDSFSLKKMKDIQLLTFKSFQGKVISERFSFIQKSKEWNVTVSQNTTLFPGQKDSVFISVNNHLGKPEENINLTAYATNGLFKNEYFAESKNVLLGSNIQKPSLFHFRSNLSISKSSYLLGNYKKWVPLFGLDTSVYYSLCLPEKTFYSYTDSSTLLENTEVSIHLSKNGILIPINIIYLNSIPVYFSGCEAYSPYSFIVKKAINKLEVRISEGSFLIDSLVVPNKYKTTIVYNYDSILPFLSKMSNKLSWNELKSLEYSLISVAPNNYGNELLVQKNRWFNLSSSYPDNQILVGPLSPDSFTYILNPNYKVIYYPEWNYEYRFSEAIARLEKKRFFKEYKLPTVFRDSITPFRFFEKQQPFPVLNPKTPVVSRYSGAASTYNLSLTNTSKLKIYMPDSIAFFRVMSNQKSGFDISLESVSNKYHFMVDSGLYYVVLHHKNGKVSEPLKLYIRPFGTTYFKVPKTIKYEIPEALYKKKPNSICGYAFSKDASSMSEKIVVLKSKKNNFFERRTVILENGFWYFPNVPFDKEDVLVSVLGNTTSSFEQVNGLFIINCNTSTLLPDGLWYSNFFPISYFKYNEANPISKMPTKNVTDLAARMPSVFNSDIGRGILIKGSRENETEYYVDGVKLRGVPTLPESKLEEVTISVGKKEKNINPNSIGGVPALYGNSSGGIADFNPLSNRIRDRFADYAYWKPEIITDKNGTASFEIQYPDNISSWDNFVIGRTNKGKELYAYNKTYTRKNLLAELVVPEFMIEGDTSSSILKITNKYEDSLNLTVNFSLNDNLLFNNPVKIDRYLTDKVKLFENRTMAGDTFTVSFSAQTETGLFDGETRKIPVFPKGTTETVGQFFVLNNDTSFTFYPDSSAGPVYLYAKTNLLEVLLEEAQNVRKYPYYCLEQSASKLAALIAEEKLCKALDKPFRFNLEKNKLVSKIINAQSYNGGFSWFEKGKENINVCFYILETISKNGLLKQMEYCFKNGLEYIAKEYNTLTPSQKLRAALLFSTLKENPYKNLSTNALQENSFDSLELTGKINWYKIWYQLPKDSDVYWNKIYNEHTQTLWGSIYWGENRFCWYNNSVSTTLAVYELANLRKDYELKQKIRQYFLEHRTVNGWRNTYESANIIHALLKDLEEDGSLKNDKPTLTVSNNTELIKTFPVSQTIENNVEPITLKKLGAGSMYVSLSQKKHNNSPLRKANGLMVNSIFESKNSWFQSGHTDNLLVSVVSKETQEFVMIEVPIPAGCTYNGKPQPKINGEVHRQYFKNKVVIFCEKLNAGESVFRIPLQFRYKGTYTLNPARAELMYFPTFFGNEKLKSVLIVN